MERKIFLSTFALFLACCLIKADVLTDDTVKIVETGNKRIIVTENANKQRIEVEKLKEGG